MTQLPPTRHLATLLLILNVALSAGCKREDVAPSSSRPHVVASFFPLYDFARALAGTNFHVVCLTPPGGDPHAMEASPQLARTVADAQLVLLLGLGMDGWVEKLAVNERKTRISMASLGIAPKRVGKSALAEFAEADHGHSHAAGADEMDPHIWLDPVLAQDILRRIADEMIAVAPQHRQDVELRRDAFLLELKTLHEEFVSGLAHAKRRQLVTFHGAFAYLFARYKLETVGVIELFPGDEPSAEYLRKLVDLMRQLKMKVIFAEPQLPDRPAQVIANEIGGRIERLDPCETILPDAPHATYLERQRKNLETLRRVLNEP